MSSSRAIPDSVRAELTTLSRSINPSTGRRWTSRGLSMWLETEHKVIASHAAIGRFLRVEAARSEAITAEALRDALSVVVLDGVGHLESSQKRLSRSLKGITDPEVLARVVDTQTRAIETMAKTAGMAAAEHTDLTSAGAPVAFQVYLPEESRASAVPLLETPEKALSKGKP